MSKAVKKPTVALAIHHPNDLKGEQNFVGGSMSDGWNHEIANQIITYSGRNISTTTKQVSCALRRSRP
jgi:hypothetical protein